MMDYVIVGAGLFGAVLARELTDAGKTCIVIDRRNHIGGNCYTRQEENITIHNYGPHIFHTNNKKIWEYVNKHTEFNQYRHKGIAKSAGNLYSFPINLLTLYQIYGVTTPAEAKKKLSESAVDIKDPQNLEEWALSKVGYYLYELFIAGYVKKMWDKDPTDLPKSIIKRIPIRTDFNDNYYFDKYQGVPVGGYGTLFDTLLAGIPVQLGVDFLDDKDYWESKGTRVIYSGELDKLFDNCYGELDWRSLLFNHKTLDTEDFQGHSIINYPEKSIPYVRITEHKHFDMATTLKTVITEEIPVAGNDSVGRLYPVNTFENNETHKKYMAETDNNKYLIGGRLANYRYLDMHQVIASALAAAEMELNINK